MESLKNNAFAENTRHVGNEFDLSGPGAVYSSKSSSAYSLVELSMPESGRGIWNPQHHSGHSATGGLSIERTEGLFTSKLAHLLVQMPVPFLCFNMFRVRVRCHYCLQS